MIGCYFLVKKTSDLMYIMVVREGVPIEAYMNSRHNHICMFV